MQIGHANSVDEYSTHVSEFVKAIQEYGSDLSVSGLNKAQTEQLKALSDATRWLSKDMPLEDVAALFEESKKVAGEMLWYQAYFHIDATMSEQKKQSLIQVIALKNAKAFQSSLAIYMPFMWDCAGLLLPKLEIYLSNLSSDEIAYDPIINNFKYTQNGIKMSIRHSFIMLKANSGWSDESLLANTSAIQSNAPSLVSALSIRQRKDLLELLNMMQATLEPGWEGYVASMRRELSSTACGKLCALEPNN